VGELGGDWQRFREHVRQRQGINVEYLDVRAASALIDDLMATIRKRANGAQPPSRSA
jgi:hypothetical protein